MRTDLGQATVRRYLISGASSGLGLSVALELQQRGHDLAILTRLGGALRTIEQLGACPLEIAQAEADFASLEGVTWATKTLAETAPFDGVIHCAGAEVVSPLRLTTDAQYRAAMMAADSAFAILRAAASKGVMADGGSIVLMSSVAAHRGTAGMAAYSASKAAIEGMARSAAVELAARRIRVNCVAAGAFRSPMHDRITKRMLQAGQDAYAAAHPLGIGEVEAVRDAILHLLSDAARWTTGSTVVVDGGFLVR